MLKKLINKPENTVGESLSGVIKAIPTISKVKGFDILVRSDIEKIKHKQVTLISGGGSGHEPAHGLYCGKGMLSAAVCGQVFTSPDVQSILQAILLVTTNESPGCLVIVKRYSGDIFNFGCAVETARTKGRKVEMIVVGEDVALLEKSKKFPGKRGLTGTVFVHKCAGAAAEAGKSLKEVLAVAQNVSKSISTMGVSLGPCIVPGNKKPNFTLKDDELELGLGIHGEAGVKRIKIPGLKEGKTADKVVGMLFEYIEKDQTLSKGDTVSIIVNNLGSTSNLEMYLLANSCLNYLENKGVVVKRTYVGAFMTALEMAGFNITVLKHGDKLLSLLDYPTDSIAWPKAVKSERKSCLVESVDMYDNFLSGGKIKEEVLDLSFVSKVINYLAIEGAKLEPKLSDLDSKVGDGDMGHNFKRLTGFVLTDLKENGKKYTSLHEMIFSLGFAIQKVGGSSGALLSNLVIKMSDSLKDYKTLSDVVNALEAGIQSVQKLGGAKVGDRTMIDAFVPALNALKKGIANDKIDMKSLSKIVAKAATDGADSTKKLIAQKGRSSYIDQKTLDGIPDPGAYAIGQVFKLWSEYLNKNGNV